jgi:uncharacterized hydrophobic protein (TIGR00271 family)
MLIQLRLVSAPDRTESAMRALSAAEGVVSVELHRDAARTPAHGDVIVADVVRERANELIARIDELGIDETGEMTIVEIDATLSAKARAASRQASHRGSDVIVWRLLETRVHQEGVPSIAYYCFMAVAALIATVAIIVDSSVLLLGAMVVGPEFGPLAAFAVAVHERRRRDARLSLVALVTGLVLAVVVATVSTLGFDAMETDIVPPVDRFFTRFVTEPNIYSAVVAFAAGMVGVMAVGLGRSAALMGVVVSATTIPAAAAIGVNAGHGEWDEVIGAATQLGINVALLTVGALVALVLYRRVERSWGN